MESEEDYIEYQREQQRQEEHEEQMDRDEVADLILVSPETGKGMSVVSALESVDGASVFYVANLSERWKVTVKMEEVAR